MFLIYLLSILSRFYFYPSIGVYILTRITLSILSRFYFYLFFFFPFLDLSYFQSYQGSIFTSYICNCFDRPIQLSILSRFYFYLVSQSWWNILLKTFNPIKVLFLHLYIMLILVWLNLLSILSRFYFYTWWAYIGCCSWILSILSRFYFY